MAYPQKTGQYLAVAHPDKPEAYAHDDGTGQVKLIWPTKYGKSPTEAEVEEWQPTSPDPDKTPAPSLEVRDYKSIDAALDNATTVLQLRDVFRAYVRKRAGL